MPLLPPDPSLDDPQALARLGQLEVVARRLVEGLMIGQHESPFKGSSVEFVEHRSYTAGDEIRHIDWRAFGKTGKYYVKEFEEETNLRAFLLLDVSGSMGYQGKTVSKLDYARILAAAFAYLLHAQRDAVGLITLDDQVRQHIEPSASPQHFRQMIKILEEAKPGQDTNLANCLDSILPRLGRRRLVILISDFFDRLPPLKRTLQQYHRAGHEVILMQVIAPEEEEFPFSRPTQFRNLERDSHRLLVDPHRLRAIYLQQFREFQEELKGLAAQCGFHLLTLSTADPLRKTLGSYLSWRARRRKTSSRAR